MPDLCLMLFYIANVLNKQFLKSVWLSFNPEWKKRKTCHTIRTIPDTVGSTSKSLFLWICLVENKTMRYLIVLLITRQWDISLSHWKLNISCYSSIKTIKHNTSSPPPPTGWWTLHASSCPSSSSPPWPSPPLSTGAPPLYQTLNLVHLNTRYYPRPPTILSTTDQWWRLYHLC